MIQTTTLEKLKELQEDLYQENHIQLDPIKSYLLQDDMKAWIFNFENDIMTEKEVINNLSSRITELIKRRFTHPTIVCPQCNGLGLEKTNDLGYFACSKCKEIGFIED